MLPIQSVAGTSGPRSGGALRFRIALVGTLGLWAAILFWLGGDCDPFWKGYRYKADGADYYNSLVDGFLSGHLAMKAPVDPALLSPDPLVRARADYLLDASLYHGKYYLSYGVTPAVVLLLPFTALTGGHLSPHAACLIFVLVGLGAGAAWLLSLRERLSAEWQGGFAFAAVSVLAVVPGVTFLVRRSLFYDLPIAAGYMWVCIAWVALWHALYGGHTSRWLILASASVGLAVGCRPNFILLAPAVLIWPALVGHRVGARRSSTWLSSLLPVSLIGAGLAWYNFARFDNPLDFGFWHGLNPYFASANPLFSPRFIFSNARAYLLTPPAVAPWFPFVFPFDSGLPRLFSNAEAMVGFMPVAALAAWVAVMVAVEWRIGGCEASTKAWSRLLYTAAFVEFVFICVLGIRAYRYAVDFLTPAAFLLVLGLARLWPLPGFVGRVARTGTFLAGLVAAVHVVLGAVQLFDGFKNTRPDEFRRLSALANPRQATLERWGAPRPGGLSLGIRFSKPDAAILYPIVTTGLPHAFDALRVVVLPNGFVKFEIYHGGFGGPETGLIPIAWDRNYELKVFMGSLFPKESDPYFEGRTKEEVQAIKSLGWLSFDGREVISRRMAFFDSSPWPTLGNASGGDGKRVAITDLRYSTAVPTELIEPSVGVAAIHAIDLALPPARETRPLPLLSSGVTGNGDLLFLDPMPDGRYRLGVDQWGTGPLYGQPFSGAMGTLQRLEVVLGPALAHDTRIAAVPEMKAAGALAKRIVVWYGGTLVGDFVIEHHLDSFGTLQVGLNDAGFSSAVGAYSGEFHPLDLSMPQQRELLRRALGVVN